MSRHWIDRVAEPASGRVPMGWANGLHVVPDEAPGVLAPMPAAWECDLSDDSLRWTPGVFEIFGLPPDVPLRREDAVAMYSAESQVELKRLRDDAIATCGSFTFEAEIRRPSGEVRWMRVTADVEVRDGRAAYLYGLKQDITHLKQ
ncbi:PAS domain-containing protein [Sphingomonas sp. OTU376]|uniref:PAS domain-containing protein n=1 Tax=Sphingomonas sp. OTU376 TaxID=3043863 RepID=UPI00313E1A24